MTEKLVTRNEGKVCGQTSRMGRKYENICEYEYLTKGDLKGGGF